MTDFSYTKAVIGHTASNMRNDRLCAMMSPPIDMQEPVRTHKTILASYVSKVKSQ